MDHSALTFGLNTFGDITNNTDGTPFSHAHVIREVIQEGIRADEAHVDFFGIGEHHRADFAVSAPDVVLATIAGQTSRLTLGSSATVLTSDDPVRVYQRFATLQAVSNRRAEIIVGRGWFAESFPLFGLNISDYDALFEERLGLFVKLIRDDVVTWRGKHRAPLHDVVVYPPLELGSLKTWVAVGASPDSVLRAARYNLPLMLAVIGGKAERYRPLIDLYRSACHRLNRAPAAVGLHSVGYIADSDMKARDEFWPAYSLMRQRIGSERGWPPFGRATFEQEVDAGSLYVGSPETVARKIASTMTVLRASRFDLRYSVGSLSHERKMRSIDLYGTEAIPMVRNFLRQARHAPV